MFNDSSSLLAYKTCNKDSNILGYLFDIKMTNQTNQKSESRAE